MAQEIEFYIRLDYRAIYVGYHSQDNENRELSYSPSGIEFMQTIIQLIRDNHNLLVGRWTVEKLFYDDERLIRDDCIEIKGRSLTTGLPDKACVSIETITEKLNTSIETTARIIAMNLENNFPDAVYEALLKSKFVLQEGDFPLTANFIKIFNEHLPVPLQD